MHAAEVQAAVEHFCAGLRQQGYRPSVVTAYGRIVRRWLHSGLDGGAWLRAQLDASRPAGGGLPTRRASVYRRALITYYDMHGLDKGTLALPRTPRYRRPMQQDALAPEHDRAFCAAIDAQPEPQATVVWLLRHLGLRVNEACALRLDDVRLDPPRLVLDDTKTTRSDAGDAPEEVPLGGKALDRLRGYLRWRQAQPAGPWLFPGARAGEAITDRTIRRAVRDIAQAAQLPTTVRVTPHTLRHTLATRLEERGVPTAVVQALLRHDDVRSTAIYQHGREDRAALLAALEPAD